MLLQAHSLQVFLGNIVPSHNLAHWLFLKFLAHGLIFVFLQSLGDADRFDQSK